MPTKCHNCGTEVDETLHFCPQCGRRLKSSGEISDGYDSEFARRVAKWILSASSIGSAIALVCLGFAFTMELVLGFCSGCAPGMPHHENKADKIASHIHVAIVVLLGSLAGLIILWIVALIQRGRK